MKWYVIQTNVKLEGLAAVQLRNQNFEVFLPLFKKRYFKTSVLYKIHNLFPGYLFVAFDIESDPWRSINGTRGVKKILCMDKERPSPINPCFIEEMMTKMDKDGYVQIEAAEDMLKRFSKGDQVKITDGVFTGRTGTYEMSDKKRISILLSCIGGQNRVWVSPNQVILSVP